MCLEIATGVSDKRSPPSAWVRGRVPDVVGDPPPALLDEFELKNASKTD